MYAWLTAFTFLLVTTLYLSSAEDQDPLQVLYGKSHFTSPPGSSVTLICQILYDSERCSQVHAVWFNQSESPLIDPEKYLTIVNETIPKKHWRRRQVLTEILNLSSKDEGSYQCRGTAVCAKSETLMGHLITVTVANKK
ncbi:hypothetical protein NL108_013218 [Boleophthalmus pectinirostris]|nr:hypothetical protein NL108_013218 [Boleophthalmus pectinirostris]